MKVTTFAVLAAAAGVISPLLTLNATPQRRSTKSRPTVESSTSAAYVSAEMTAGRINPRESKPGDRVALRLKKDLRANGQVVLKQGSVIEGVVKRVRKAAGQKDESGSPQSMIEIVWLTPAVGSGRQLSIALQSVVQHMSPVPTAKKVQADKAEWRLAEDLPPAPLTAPGTANPALMNMPTVVAVDAGTVAAMESAFGMESMGSLYKVGRGEVAAPGGPRHELDIFSHMSNDSVITSKSQNFEVSTGAQVELLVGVRK